MKWCRSVCTICETYSGKIFDKFRDYDSLFWEWLEEYWVVENGSAVRLFEKSSGNFGVCFLKNFGPILLEKFYKENKVKWKRSRVLICCQRRGNNDWITKIQGEFINCDWRAKLFLLQSYTNALIVERIILEELFLY